MKKDKLYIAPPEQKLPTNEGYKELQDNTIIRLTGLPERNLSDFKAD